MMSSSIGAPVSLFLGTGCGRSGTLWAARFFTGIGFNTLHEAQYTPVKHGPIRRSEISWLAVPYLNQAMAHARILRIVRNPFDAVASGMQMDFQQRKRKTAFDKFLGKHRPDIVAPDDKLTRVIRWVATWDAPLDDVPHKVLRPDADRLDQLGEAVEYATGAVTVGDRIAQVCAELGDTVNTKPRRRPEVTREDIMQHPEGWKIRKRAERFGYV